MRLDTVTWLALVALGCSSSPPPPPANASDESAASKQMEAENQRLREQVGDLERDLAAAREAAQNQAAERAAAEEPEPEPEPAAPPPAPVRSRPDPDEVYSVPIEGSYAEGPRHGLVTMVVATEFACPYCQKAEGTIEQLRKDYRKDLKVVYQSYVVHPAVATEPALALCAADKQRKAARMKKALWEQYEAYKQSRTPEVFSREAMLEIAKKLRLRRARFEKSMEGECKEQTQREQARLGQLGVSGVPAFFINGRYISGAQPIESFKKVIDEELAKARDLVASGVDRKSLYSAIVAFGKKQL